MSLFCKSLKGYAVSDIIGDSSIGWDKLFDGQRHQVAVRVMNSRVQFYYNCHQKGGNFLHEKRTMTGNPIVEFAKRVNDEKSIPIL